MAARKKPKKAGPDLDLDAFKSEPLTVSIDGKEYALAEFTLGNLEKFAGLKDGFREAGANSAKQMSATIAVYGLIVPDCPADVIRQLGPDQQKALTEFWLAGATGEMAEQERDADAVLTDPTPPA